MASCGGGCSGGGDPGKEDEEDEDEDENEVDVVVVVDSCKAGTNCKAPC